MTSGFSLEGDVERALGSVSVPSYAVDSSGVVRWINSAAERLVGDVRGLHFTSVVAPEDRPRARELFARKVLGGASVTDSTGVLLSTEGTRVGVEISSVPLRDGERIVGVFGLLAASLDDETREPHPRLTPRQAEVLHLLERGRSTQQIARELHLSTETVRNHVRHLLRALGVNSRLEAVAVAHRRS
jgi:PAS domain S-box-containing protein